MDFDDNRFAPSSMPPRLVISSGSGCGSAFVMEIAGIVNPSQIPDITLVGFREQRWGHRGLSIDAICSSKANTKCSERDRVTERSELVRNEERDATAAISLVSFSESGSIGDGLSGSLLVTSSICGRLVVWRLGKAVKSSSFSSSLRRRELYSSPSPLSQLEDPSARVDVMCNVGAHSHLPWLTKCSVLTKGCPKVSKLHEFAQTRSSAVATAAAVATARIAELATTPTCIQWMDQPFKKKKDEERTTRKNRNVALIMLGFADGTSKVYIYNDNDGDKMSDAQNMVYNKETAGKGASQVKVQRNSGENLIRSYPRMKKGHGAMAYISRPILLPEAATWNVEAAMKGAERQKKLQQQWRKDRGTVEEFRPPSSRRRPFHASPGNRLAFGTSSDTGRSVISATPRNHTTKARPTTTPLKTPTRESLRHSQQYRSPLSPSSPSTPPTSSSSSPSLTHHPPSPSPADLSASGIGVGETKWMISASNCSKPPETRHKMTGSPRITSWECELRIWPLKMVDDNHSEGKSHLHIPEMSSSVVGMGGSVVPSITQAIDAYCLPLPGASSLLGLALLPPGTASMKIAAASGFVQTDTCPVGNGRKYEDRDKRDGNGASEAGDCCVALALTNKGLHVVSFRPKSGWKAEKHDEILAEKGKDESNNSRRGTSQDDKVGVKGIPSSSLRSVVPPKLPPSLLSAYKLPRSSTTSPCSTLCSTASPSSSSSPFVSLLCPNSPATQREKSISTSSSSSSSASPSTPSALTRSKRHSQTESPPTNRTSTVAARQDMDPSCTVARVKMLAGRVSNLERQLSDIRHSVTAFQRQHTSALAMVLKALERLKEQRDAGEKSLGRKVG